MSFMVGSAALRHFFLVSLISMVPPLLCNYLYLRNANDKDKCTKTCNHQMKQLYSGNREHSKRKTNCVLSFASFIGLNIWGFSIALAAVLSKSGEVK